MALNQAQREAGSFSSCVGGKGKQVHFSTERLPGGIARVLCSPFWGRDTALSQGRIQLPFLGIMALIPLVPLCSLEKENSMVAPSLRSQGMVLRFSDNIFHLFSGVSRRGSRDMVYGFLLRYLFTLKIQYPIGEPHSFLNYY